MKEELKLIIFNIIYNNLGLKDLENNIVKNEIKCKNIKNPNNYPMVSKYFFLLNDVHLENLEPNELEELTRHYNEFMKDNKNYNELCNFLIKNIKKILFENQTTGYVNYGAAQQSAPSDALVLAFHYNDLETDEEKENFIIDILNYIQFEASKKIKMKIAVLKYGVYVDSKNFVI